MVFVQSPAQRFAWQYAPLGASAGSTRSKALLDEVFERLQSRSADLLRSGLALDRDGLLRERVDAGAIFGGRLFHRAQLEKAGDHEFTRAARAELLLDDLGEPVEHLVDALLVELGHLRKLRHNLRLGQPFASHLGSSCGNSRQRGATPGPITSAVRAR